MHSIYRYIYIRILFIAILLHRALEKLLLAVALKQFNVLARDKDCACFADITAIYITVLIFIQS